jgi:hypothetical protein
MSVYFFAHVEVLIFEYELRVSSMYATYRMAKEKRLPCLVGAVDTKRTMYLPGGGSKVIGKGIGKGGMRCKRIHLHRHTAIDGISKPAIRRLARKGGVKRLSGMIYKETRAALRAFLEVSET